MKITVDLTKTTLDRLRREAARLGCTVSEVADYALLLYLKTHGRGRKPLRLLRHKLGAALVDIADREALYDAMDDLKLYKRS